MAWKRPLTVAILLISGLLLNRQFKSGKDKGCDQSCNDMPDPPPGNQYGHSTQTLEEIKDQYQSQGRVLDPDLNADSP